MGAKNEREHAVKNGLNGRKVLVLEDEYFLADDLRRGLEGAGAVVLGPAASLAEGLRLLRDGSQPHLAVLDVNLRGATAYEMAEILAAHGVPFVFATGYDTTQLPARFRAVPRLIKPYELGALLAALESLA